MNRIEMKDIIEEIKSRCEISSVISEYVVLKQSGSNFTGLCPFHDEKTPSFHINTSKQIFKCFGCGESGDVINFIMKKENLDFMDAIELLSKKCGVEIKTNIDEKTRLMLDKSKKFQELHTEAARFYFKNLTREKNNGYKYLRSRGVSDDIIIKFGLGFSKNNWKDLKDFLLNKGYIEQELIECGLLLKSKNNSNSYDRFRNRVMFPIFDYRGNILAFGGRTLDNSIPKYLNSPDSIIFNKRNNLYGLNLAKKHIANSTIILVEGYMDLISLFQFGIKNVVATLGTSLTEQQSKLLNRYAKNIIISYDSDEAGTKATLRAIEILKKSNFNIKVLDLGDSKDPDEFIRKNGLKKFEYEIEQAINFMKYKLIKLKETFNIDIGEEKIKYIKEACRAIKSLNSPIDIEYYMKYLSQDMDVSLESIKKEVHGKNFDSIKTSHFVKNQDIRPIEIVTVNKNSKLLAEKMLLKLMLIDKKIRDNILLKINENDLLDEVNRDIFKFIVKKQEFNKIIIDKNEKICIDIESFENINSISVNSINFKNKREIDELINTVKKNSLKLQIEKLQEEQRMLENNRDLKEVDVKIMDIALKIVEINKMLKNL